MANNTIKTILITVIIFIGLIYLVQGQVKFQALILNDSGQIIGSQDLKVSKAIGLSQSLFNADVGKLTLQSAVPLSDEAKKAQFRASVKNPFDVQANLTESRIYKDKVLVDTEKFNAKVFSPREEKYFDTAPIDITGPSAIRKEITVEYDFVSVDLRTNTQSYGFEYIFLKKCEDSNDCSGEASLCDVSNIAGLSSAENDYCVIPCEDNSQCPTNQVCKRVVCGY